MKHVRMYVIKLDLTDTLLFYCSDAPMAIISLEGAPLPFTNQTMRIIAQQGDPGPTLLCSSNASPPSTHAWQKYSESNVQPRGVTWNLVTGEQGVAMVWSRPLKYEDSGHYVCNATNGIGEDNIRLYLLVKSKPKFWCPWLLISMWIIVLYSIMLN